MHLSVLAFVLQVLPPSAVAGRRVLEVGSRDVNGSVRPLIEAAASEYLGVDEEAGPSVDRVLRCEDLHELGRWDVVISTEMLEHVEDWRVCMAELVQAVEPGGSLLLTTRSPGFPFHPYPRDCWRYPVEAMKTVLEAVGLSGMVVADPEQAGVFAFASKPKDWKWLGMPSAWSTAEVLPV